MKINSTTLFQTIPFFLGLPSDHRIGCYWKLHSKWTDEEARKLIESDVGIIGTKDILKERQHISWIVARWSECFSPSVWNVVMLQIVILDEVVKKRVASIEDHYTTLNDGLIFSWIIVPRRLFIQLRDRRVNTGELEQSPSYCSISFTYLSSSFDLGWSFWSSIRIFG